MSNIQFTDNEINLLRLHYLQEYNATLKKLHDVQAMLNKLGISSETANIKSIPEKIQKNIVEAPKKELATTTQKILITKPIRAIKAKADKPAKTKVADKPEPISIHQKSEKAESEPKTKSPLAKLKVAKSKITKPSKANKISWRKTAEKILKTENKFMRASSIYELAATQYGLSKDNRKKDMQALQTTLYQLAKIKGELQTRKVGSTSEFGLLGWS